jgi:hypothetical protein
VFDDDDYDDDNNNNNNNNNKGSKRYDLRGTSKSKYISQSCLKFRYAISMNKFIKTNNRYIMENNFGVNICQSPQKNYSQNSWKASSVSPSRE